MCFRFGILPLLGILCSTCLGRAQSASCVDSSLSSQDSEKTRINITGVEFQGENPLSDTLRTQLVQQIQQQERWVMLEESDSSWVSDVVYPIREALLNQGYFKVSVEGTPYLVRALASEKLYILTVAIESGPQYRLGKVRIASASDTPLVLSEAILRQQISLQEGELFDTSKIRDGIEAISRLYGSKGYIDTTVEPDTMIDDSLQINLLVRVSEEKRYSIGRIEVLGVNPKRQIAARLPQQAGDILDFALWRNFFETNKSGLLADASIQKNLQVRRNVSTGTADIILDFRPCPQV